jgi:hypothetical protein
MRRTSKAEGAMNVERRTASSHPAGLAGVIAGLLAVTTLTTSLTGSASALMVRRRAPFAGCGFDVCTAPAQDGMNS